MVPLGDSGIKDSGLPDNYACTGGGGDAGCNALQMCGRNLTLVNVTKTVPAATGGTIVDGIYDLTSTTFYQTGSAMTATIRETVQVTSVGAASDGGAEAQAEGGSAEAGADDASLEAASEAGSVAQTLTIQEISDQGSGPATYTWSVDVLTSNHTFNWLALCPSGSSMSFSLQYSASATSLLVYELTSDGTWEFTYTHR